MTVTFMSPDGIMRAGIDLPELERLIRHGGTAYWHNQSATAALNVVVGDVRAYLTIMVEEGHGVMLRYCEGACDVEYVMADPTKPDDDGDVVTVYPGGEGMDVPTRCFVSPELALDFLEHYVVHGTRRTTDVWDEIG